LNLLDTKGNWKKSSNVKGCKWREGNGRRKEKKRKGKEIRKKGKYSSCNSVDPFVFFGHLMRERKKEGEERKEENEKR